MTFVLKDIAALLDHFKMTKSVMLFRYKTGSIENLHEPRRSEMLLLEKVLLRIETQVKELQSTSRAKSDIKAQTNNLISVFYGAMLLARHDALTQSAGEGMLTGRLNDALTLKEDREKITKPSIEDTAKFHIALNKFLQVELFNSGDSRFGLKEEHLLSTVKKEDLQRLIQSSYELEECAQKNDIETLVTDSKKTPGLREYNLDIKIPDSATSNFISWDTLRVRLTQLITEEYVSKGKPTVDALGQPRAAQLNFLLKIHELLSTSSIPDKGKIAVLAGSMHLIRQQIRDEYKLFSPTSSVVHNLLSEVLDVNKTHDIEGTKTQDIEALLHAANHFIRYLTLVKKPVEEQKEGVKKAVSISNPFASIDGFNLQNTLALFQVMICKCRKKSSQNVFAAFVDCKKIEQKSSLWMSSLTEAFGIFATPVTAAPSGEEEEEKHTQELSGAEISPEK